jgi:hypothetical protein
MKRPPSTLVTLVRAKTRSGDVMPTPDMRDVYSSHVRQVGHDGENLHVIWDTGRHSIYKGVPADLADQVSKSWSVGKALTEQIKEKFEHEYVQPT